MRLLALKLATLLPGFLMGFPLWLPCFICHQDKITKFSPTQGAVCSQVAITGTIYAGSSLVGPAVTFGNVPAQAQLRRKYFILPYGVKSNPLEIFATVPPGAETSDISVRVTGSGLTRGVDYTFRTPFTVMGSPEAPFIKFTSPNVTIEPGTPTTLSWEASGTVTVLVLSYGGIKLLNGEVVGATVQDLPPGTTSITVSPTATTTYTLTAYNSCVPSRSTETTVTVLPPLMLSLNPSNFTLPPGQSQPVTATINPDLNNVAITCSTPPASKVSCTPPPNSIPSGGTSTTITILADPNAPTSTVLQTVTVEAAEATPGVGMAFATLSVTVPALKLSLNPSNLALSPGQSQTVVATVTPPPTTSESVQISCQASTVLTCNTPTISSGNPASLVVTASPSVAPATIIPPLVVTAAQVPPGTEKGTAHLDVTFVQPPRQTGNFAAMTTVATGLTPVTAIGSCMVQIKNNLGDPTYDQYDAYFTCGAKTAILPFATTSTANGENFNLGGVGVSANSTLAVVISDNNGADHEGPYVHFTPLTLPGLVAVGGFSMNDNFTNNIEHVTFTAADTPTIYASPDASLIILTGLTPAPPSQAGVQLLVLYDISNPSQPRVIPSPSGTPEFGSSFTAQVQPATSAGHQYVSIHFDGSAAAVLYEIY